ncbi:hypothetical protein PPERSA_03080 [Pseudocohnilembus persalinus]|uniref:Uncharacterized protein n=1 Tax=Pseudocohnilembus persalinus TaxID=266149 RepID=A0A0V0QL63_PSEPJ|nr:hypothetical protein PPERSA_03080 [Pseudocohnilembus persalinus]|eukprot:KRX02989.1 hypothetical protein PPERSA_03080 [Pseudocohnilembus persalinus]
MTKEAQFRRESENRTFSERQLDKFILNQEKQTIRSEKQKLDDEITKRIQTNNKTFSFGKNQLLKNQQNENKGQDSPLQKNENQIQQQQTETQIKEKNNNQSQNQSDTQQQQNQQMSLKDAFTKVCKNLSHENKFQKALQTLQQLVIKHIHHASLLQRFDILLLIFQNRQKFSKREDLKQIAQDIYKIIPIVDNLEQDKQQIHLKADPIEQHQVEVKELKDKQKQEQKNVVMSIRDKLKKKNNEDKIKDQQQQNSEKLENNQQNQKQNQQEQEILERQIPEYDYTCQSENAEKYINNDKEFLFFIKQTIIIEIMEFLVEFYKNKWARSSINQILADIYYNKKFLFDEKLHEKMDLLAEKWIDQKNSQTSQDFKRSQIDGSILGIGNSKNQVTDGRATRIILDNGANKWGNNQR